MSNPDRRVHASETFLAVVCVALLLAAIVGTIHAVWP